VLRRVYPLRTGKAEQKMTSMMKQAEDGYRPAYETIAEKITELISTADLKPGDRLPTEHELSEQLGVSRTVVREAVKVLVATGLVYTRRGSGLYVANKVSSSTPTMIDTLTLADPTQVISLYEFRIMLEPQAARLAAERITPHELRELREVVALNQRSAETQQRQQFRETDAAFHRVIAEATHNPFLASTIATTTRAQGWIFDIAAGRTQALLLTYAEQHEGILRAIQEGEPDTASQAMQAHLEWALSHSKQEVRRRLGVEAGE
jgi:GntR family transcriptional regulator, transcriptional repressor for pyruvate dehydrogenase complex